MKSKKLSEVIIKTFKSNGFVLSEPDVLLDSDYIIERSGEKFRSSMLTFDSEDGKTMCLRPDLTVASCISFLQKKTSSKIYYSGQAYRRSGGKGANFINDQLGIEILGSKNHIKDDFKVISTILSSAKKIKMKISANEIKTGMIIDLKDLKKIIKDKIISKIDHNVINNVSFMKNQITTTENLCIQIWKELSKPIKSLGGKLHKIRIHETENNYFEYYGKC